MSVGVKKQKIYVKLDLTSFQQLLYIFAFYILISRTNDFSQLVLFIIF